MKQEPREHPDVTYYRKMVGGTLTSDPDRPDHLLGYKWSFRAPTKEWPNGLIYQAATANGAVRGHIHNNKEVFQQLIAERDRGAGI